MGRRRKKTKASGRNEIFPINDLSNVLVSANIPILILGTDLNIRLATPQAEKVLNVRFTDVGRSVADIKLGVDIPDLEQLVVKVIDTMSYKEREVRDRSGRWHRMTIRPFKTGENKIEGAILAFQDIDDLKRRLDRISETNKLNAALNVIDMTMYSALEFGEIMRLVVKEGCEAMGAEQSAVALREDDKWVMRYVHRFPPEIIGTGLSDEELPHAAIDAETGEPVVINDAYEDKRVSRQIMENLGIRSVMIVPLIVDQRPVGLIFFNHSKRAGAFSEAQVGFGKKLAASISLAIENSRLFDLQRAAEKEARYELGISDLLLDGADALAARTELPEVLDSLTGIISEISGRSRVSIELVDGGGKNEITVAVQKGPGEPLGTKFKLDQLSTFAKRCVREKAIIQADFEADGVSTGDREFGKHYNNKLVLFVPVIRQEEEEEEEEVLALIVIDEPGQRRGFTPREIRLVQGIADQAAVAIDRARLYNQQKETVRLNESLTKIDSIIHSTLEIEQVLKEVLDEAVKAASCEMGGINIREGEYWKRVALRGLPKKYLGERLTDKQNKAAALVAKTGKPVIIEDAASDPRIDPAFAEKYGIASTMIFPIKETSRVVGVIFFNYHSAPVSFSDVQIDFARKLAASLSLAIQNSELLKKERETAEELGTVVETLAEGLITYEKGGLITGVNFAAEKILGFKRKFLIGRSFAEFKMATMDGKPVPKKGMPFEQVVRSGKPIYGVEYLVNKADGSKLILSFNATPLTKGKIRTGVLLSFADITKRRQAEEALKGSEVKYRAVAQSASDAIVTIDSKGSIILWNHAAEKQFGYKAKEAIGKDITMILPEPYRQLHKQGLVRFLKTGKSSLFGKTIENYGLKKDGSLFPLELTVAPWKSDEGYFFTGITRDITERRQVETERERAKELSDALNEINVIITSTLDLEKMMRQVTVEACKAIGAESAGYILLEDKSWVLKYVYGVHEEEAGRRLAPEEIATTMLAAERGEPVMINDASRDDRIDPDLVEEFNLKSMLVIPLLVKKELVGGMGFNYHSKKVEFTEAEVDFAKKLTISLSLGIENLRVFEAEHHVADTLQQHLLTMPSKVPGIELGHVYQSATVEKAMVGGDFYDVFEFAPEKIAILLGDVSGKGLEAAVLTSLVKNTIKAYCHDDCSTAIVVSKTSEIVRKYSEIDIFVTVFFGVLDVGTGTLTFCNAGHPAPLVKSKNRVTPLEGRSTAIGFFPDLKYLEEEYVFQKGDCLVLYSDGVIEARKAGKFFGEKKLMNIIKKLDPVAREIPGLIFDEVSDFTGGYLIDDVAILTICWKP